MSKRVRPWLGGYVRETKGGRTIFVIEKWLNGRRYHLSTRCNTEKAALKELERFEASPSNYKPDGGAGVRLAPELVAEYRGHQIAAGLTLEWIDEVTRCLGGWTEMLGDRDLRNLSLHRDLRPTLDRWKTRRPHRIKAIKGLFRWMREEKGLVTHAQDCTVDLRVPQSKPEKWTRRKVIPHEDVAAVLAFLQQPTRDVLHLLSATAWHVSEVRGFAAGGEIVIPVGEGAPLAVLITRQKSGELTRNSIIYPEHLEAAQRLRAIGKLPTRVAFARHMRRAIEKAGVPWFGMGQMRHSVLTWGVERGASVAATAEFADHRSTATTKKFYLDLAVPKLPIPILRLLP